MYKNYFVKLIILSIFVFNIKIIKFMKRNLFNLNKDVITNKFRAFCIAISTLLFFSSCSHFKSISDNKKIDVRLVGTWVGEEEDKQVKGVVKKWEMQRDNTGKFRLFFKFTVEGKVREIVEDGTWWIENGLFYEYHNSSKLTDTYKYIVINSDLVKFEMQSSDVDFNSDEYIFLDARKGSKEDKSKNGK